MRQLELTQVLLCRLVFPESKPYGVLDLEAPRKLPAPTWEKGKGSEVSVMLTVSAAAAKNLNGMMVAVAELLSMKIPNSYEVLFPESPARAGIEPKKGEAEGPGGKEKSLGGKSPEAGPDWLKQFDAVLPGYTLKSQLDILSLLKQVGLLEEDRVGIWLGQRRQRALGRVESGWEERGD